jgi:serpin B
LGSQELHLLNVASASLVDEMRAWPQLSFPAGIFADRSISLRPEFVSTAASAHGALARSLDIQNQVVYN